MQGHLRRHARRQPTERMGPFPIQSAGMVELSMDRLHTLADASAPAPQRLGPRRLAGPLGRAEDRGPLGRPPRPLVGLALKALVDDVRTLCGRPATGQARMGLVAQGTKRLRQRLGLGAGRSPAQTGHPA